MDDTSAPLPPVQTPVKSTAQGTSVTPITPPSPRSPFLKSPVALWGVLGIIVFIIISSLLFFAGKTSTKQSQKVVTEQQTTGNQSTQSSSQNTNTAVDTTTTAVKGSPENKTSLPLGDGKYTTSGARKGYIYLCSVQQGGGGAQESGTWISGKTWNDTIKPKVSGSVTWPTATFTNTISGTTRTLTGNDLPVQATTGIFPIQSTDPAYQYDRNPNTITASTYSLTLPVNPSYSSTPSCMGGEVGVMLNGVPLFNGFDALNRDAAAHEIQDSCDGHPQEQGHYHYHSLSSCIKNISSSTVIGFALDGYPLTGPVLPDGNYLTTNDLDECHGMTSEIVLDGKRTTMYHYVMTEDFPYSVSCFHAKPVRLQLFSHAGSTQLTSSGQQKPSGQQPQPKQSPQQAFTACSGKTSRQSCSVNTPNGTITGTCQMPPNQSSLICVPNNPPQ